MESHLYISWILTLLSCLLLTSIVSATRHVATFNIRGVKGRVVFAEVPNTAGVRIDVAELSGLTNNRDYDWSIRSLPMLYDREDKCASEFIGAVFRNLSTSVGLLTNVTGTSTYTDAGLTLKGSESISGRTVSVDVGGSSMYCASILPEDDVITAVAQFRTPFAGTVTFRQRANDPDAETTIFVDLFDVTEPIVAQAYNWHVSDNSGINHNMTVEEWCTATMEAAFADIGDLTPKFGAVNVKTVHTRQRYYYVDTNITLSGDNSIVDKSLVFSLAAGSIGGEGTRAACSPVRVLEPKTVFAEFNYNNVTGNVSFSQTSPWEATTIKVNFFNLRQMASGFHVHMFPAPHRILESDFPGSADMISGHWNPYDIDVSSDPDFPNGTNDQYEIGDISGKFGNLEGQNDFSAVNTDWNMPMFGENSIVGRSMMIHMLSTERWVFANIGYPKPVKTVTAVFTYPLVGQITFRQDKEDPYSDTSVFVDLAHSDGSVTTYDHDWHIHVAKIGDDHLDQTGRCSSTRGHYNPFEVKLTEDYATECDTDVTRRCEIGDFSKKYGRITVPSSVRTQVGKSFFTDVQLPLSGVYTVADRSVVVHVRDGAPERLGCGDTLEVFEAVTAATMWSGDIVSGSITFTQTSEFDSVTIKSDVAGLGGIVGPWHIHYLPVPYGAASPCSGPSVQGHYNPLGVLGSPPSSTVDYYEMGDFSGKFGYWEGLNVVYDAVVDPSISLFGPRSSTGRSMVLHLASDGSRYRCATMEPVLGEGDFRIEARADITTSRFSGYMLLSQTHFSNGRMGDTIIEALFAPTDSNADIDTYDWTIREGDVTSSSCDNSKSIFNPNTVAIDGEYAYHCNVASQLRCQVGDLTSKNGNYYSYNERTLLTDTNLPLAGTAGVIGRPLYLVSSSSDTVGCVTVQPLPSTGVQTQITFKQMIDFDVYAFKLFIADTLSDVESWQIVAPHYPTDSEEEDRCSDLTLWIIGANAEAAKNELLAKSAGDELGIYSPTDKCREGTGAASNIAPLSSALVVCIAVVTSLWQHIMTS